MSISDSAFHEDASDNTKFYALFCYFFLRKSKVDITEIFAKSKEL